MVGVGADGVLPVTGKVVYCRNSSSVKTPRKGVAEKKEIRTTLHILAVFVKELLVALEILILVVGDAGARSTLSLLESGDS